MSGVVLSPAELLSSTVSDLSGKGDENIAITETPIRIDARIDDISCNDDDGASRIPTASISTNVENQNNLDCVTNRQRSPTTNSIGSNNISIVTLDENENDSSVIDSDSDVDEVINCNHSNEFGRPSGIVLLNKNIDNQSSILCTNNDLKPNIGSIAVQNSSDITFGNKTFYQGPVTIKQFVYDKNKWREAEQTENDNLGYVNNSTDNLSRKEKGKSPKFSCNSKSSNFIGCIQNSFGFQGGNIDFSFHKLQSNVKIDNDNSSYDCVDTHVLVIISMHEYNFSFTRHYSTSDDAQLLSTMIREYNRLDFTWVCFSMSGIILLSQK